MQRVRVKSNHLPSPCRRTSGKTPRQSRKRGSLPFQPGQRQFRPCLEALEERLALAAPTVIEPTATAFTPVTTLLGGNLTSDGGNVVIQRCVVYSLISVDSGPKIGGPGVTVASSPLEAPVGAFAVTVGSLMPNSWYSFLSTHSSR